MCEISKDVLLLACGPYGLRAFSLSSKQLIKRDPFTLPDVYSVAFDAATDTLLLALRVDTDTSEDVWLASLQRAEVAGDWREVHRVQTGKADWNFVSLSLVGDSRLIFGRSMSEKLYVFDVSADHHLRAVGAIALEDSLRKFACTRLGADPLVAITDYGNKGVSLNRLVTLPIDPLARADLIQAGWLLFRGDLLLVADFNRDAMSHAVVPFRVTGGQLTRLPELLGTNAGVYVDIWCLAGDRLAVVVYKSGDLLLFAFE